MWGWTIITSSIQSSCFAVSHSELHRPVSQMFIGSNWSENVAVFHAEVMKSMDSYGEVELSDNTHMLAAFKLHLVTGVHLTREESTRHTALFGEEDQLQNVFLDAWQKCNLGKGGSRDYIAEWSVHTHPASTDCGGCRQQLQIQGLVLPSIARRARKVWEGPAHNSKHICCPPSIWALVRGDVHDRCQQKASPLPDPSYFVYGYSSYYYLNLYNISSNTTSFAETQNILEKTVRKDAAFIGRYAISMQLEVVAEYDRQYESDSRVFFGIEWILKQ
eukprot:1145290-Pelagomonas_calceolata.AAC.1